MKRCKHFTWALLFMLFTSIMVPAPTYAANLPGISDKGILGVLEDLLAGWLLKDLLHINIPGSGSVSTNNGKEVVGFYAEWWDTDTSSYTDLSKHTDVINTIAPFWATLNSNGSVSDRGGNDHASVVRFAKNNKISNLLLINNAKQDSDAAGIHAVLSNAGVRKTAIDNVEAYIKQYGLNGVNIDFEAVPAGDRDNLTQFMKELSARLKPQGLIVSIDVIPKHNEENDFSIAYDYAKLAQYCDKIMLMTYDYHGAWSDAGSVADIRMIERDVKYALTMIPANKLYLGIAGYGYDWSSKGVESLEFNAITNLINRFGAKVIFDDASKTPHFNYTGTDGVSHQVWYENAQSLKYKLDLVNQYNLAGVALWKLGEEDPASWQVIKDKLGR